MTQIHMRLVGRMGGEATDLTDEERVNLGLSPNSIHLW
jgi:hypothetical protein